MYSKTIENVTYGRVPCPFPEKQLFCYIFIRPSIHPHQMSSEMSDDVNNMPNRLFSTLLSLSVRHLPSNVISAPEDISPLIKVISYSRDLEIHFMNETSEHKYPRIRHCPPSLSVPRSRACPTGKMVLTKMPMLPLGESMPPTTLKGCNTFESQQTFKRVLL